MTTATLSASMKRKLSTTSMSWTCCYEERLKRTPDLRPIYHWTERRICGDIMICFLALVMQIKFQKLLEETGSKYGYTDVIRSSRKVNIVKLKVKEREHLVRTEVHGAANIAFRAVGAPKKEL